MDINVLNLGKERAAPLLSDSSNLTIGHKDGAGALQAWWGSSLLGTTYGLKYAIDEERAGGGRQSFPSRHISLSFTAAEFMRKRYAWEYGVPAYALASFIAYSRVEADRHYPHDVIAGAAIGILSSYLFARPYKGWKAKAEGAARRMVLN